VSDIDEASLARWMQGRIPNFSALVALEKFAGGQSNPTYRVETAERRYVLRRKPFGTLLPSAHAVEREYRVLAALHPIGFPVPAPIALCEDHTVIGSPFYLMEMVAGRTFQDGTLPAVSVADRRAYYEAMIDTIAALHSIDHESVGLGDFGRPGNYVERQISRWTRQYRASQTDDLPDVERLIEWLPRTVPQQSRTSVIHGDYRIDNLIYSYDSPQVRAVLDWELTTIGDPLADFTYLAMCWALPCDGRAGLNGVDLQQKGLLTLDEAVDRYCTATRRDRPSDLHWYFAYNLFRAASIVQGIKKRIIEGNASSSEAVLRAETVAPLARAAWAEARRAGATH
jgi:aminoglycoside phosphotransferase (APT) family kinase protein